MPSPESRANQKSAPSETRAVFDLERIELPPRELTGTVTDQIAALKRLAAPLSVGAFVVQALSNAITRGKVLFNPNGHWRRGKDFSQFSERDLQRFFSRCATFWSISDEDALRIATSIIKQEPLNPHQFLGNALLGVNCGSCGIEPGFETNGLEVRVTSKCSLPGGAFPIKFELNVPSGKIVFANDLRQWFKVAGSFFLDSDRNIRETTLRYAREEMAHCFLQHWSGMTGSFAVREYGENLLEVVPRPMHLEGQDEQGRQKVFKRPPLRATARVLGEIPMQLWWWSAADYNQLKSRFDKEADFTNFLKSGAVVVSVQPGNYRIVHSKLQRGKPGDQRVAYRSQIRRIGGPREGNLGAEVVNIRAGQVVWNSIRKHPGLFFPKEKEGARLENEGFDLARELNRTFRNDNLAHLDDNSFQQAWDQLRPEDRLRAIVKVVDSMLLGTGTGYEWDTRGWCIADIDIQANAKSIEIPTFPATSEWRDVPLAHCALSEAAGIEDVTYGPPEAPVVTEMGFTFRQVKPAFVNKEFRTLAFNVLHSAFQRGVRDPEPEENSYLRENRENSPKIALLLISKLAKLYPDDVPSSCRSLLERIQLENTELKNTELGNTELGNTNTPDSANTSQPQSD